MINNIKYGKEWKRMERQNSYRTLKHQQVNNGRLELWTKLIDLKSSFISLFSFLVLIYLQIFEIMSVDGIDFEFSASTLNAINEYATFKVVKVN